MKTINVGSSHAFNNDDDEVKTSSSDENDDTEGEDEAGEKFSDETDNENKPSEKSSMSRDEIRARDAEETMLQLQRVDTNIAFGKGIPGHYEDFSYIEAKKVMEDIKRAETMVMNKLKLGLSQRLLASQVTKQLEKKMEADELDQIFRLDYSSEEDDLNKSTDRNSSSNRQSIVDDVTQSLSLENVSEGYESTRKNNVEEDMRVASTIIQGIAEYTEFKVHFKRKHSWKRIEKQLNLDKDLVRLCIMRCFHPDKLMQEIRAFVVHFLGKKFVEPPRFNFSQFLNTTSKRVPVLFMVGSDVNCL